MMHSINRTSMARYPRPIIHSEKKEVTWSFLAQNAAAEKEVTIYEGVASADVNTATEIETGSKVTWVYFEFHFSPEVITNTKIIHWQIEFVPEGMTIGTPSTYNAGDKSYIIKRGMAMLVKDLATVFKERFVVKIPRSYQRVKVNTELKFRYIASSTETINTCGFTICKPTK